jgi:hypothetical protein
MQILFKKIRETAAYIVGVVLLLFITAKILGNEAYVGLLNELSFYHITVSLLISFFLFLINGYIIAYLVKQQYRTSIRLVDIVLLPFMMHLFSYIIPIRGGLLFSALFLKLKYNIKGTEGIAIGVYSLIIGLMITGLCGVYFTYHNNIFVSVWTFLSLLLILSPLLVGVSERLLDGIVLRKTSVLNKIKTILSAVSRGSRELFLNYKISIVMLVLTMLNIVLYIYLLFWITIAFNIQASLEKIVMFALMIRISTLVRIIPGNLGIQEFFSGSVFYLLGGELNDGLAIALFVRFVSLLLTFTIGTTGVLMNMKGFSMQEIKKLWSASEQSGGPEIF